jgi:hypothetical protein
MGQLPFDTGFIVDKRSNNALIQNRQLLLLTQSVEQLARHHLANRVQARPRNKPIVRD